MIEPSSESVQHHASGRPHTQMEEHIIASNTYRNNRRHGRAETRNAESPLPTTASEKPTSRLQVYEPMEVPLELPEPAPHNTAADEITNGTHAASSVSTSTSIPITHLERGNSSSAVGRIGLMRTSPVPLTSQLQSMKQKIARKTRLKKGRRHRDASEIESTEMIVQLPSGKSYAAAVIAGKPGQSPYFDTSLEYVHDLPPERDSGNIEYKWKLLDKTSDRLVHLTTQLAYRLSEGDGQMLYELGVNDNGYPQGLSSEDLDASIATVTSMATTLQCEVKVITRANGQEGQVAEVLVRRIGDVASTAVGAHSTYPHSTTSSTLSSPLVGSSSPSLPSPLASPSLLHAGDLRIALIGSSSSGKTSLLGCLVSNQRDDGRGRSRLHVFRHRHEIENGRTSAIARQILGFDANGNITNYQVHRKQTLGIGLSQTAVASPVTFASPQSPPVQPKKKEKGISSLFGDEDDFGSEEESSDSEVNLDDDHVIDESPTISLQTLAPTMHDQSTSLSLNGEDQHDGHTSQACSTNDWQHILEQSHKVYTFFDLPSDYYKTTIYGLIGTSSPDYCCIVVSCANANENGHHHNHHHSSNSTTAASSTSSSNHSNSSHSLVSSLTREQIFICCALGIPFMLVLCKSDLTPDPESRQQLIRSLQQICAEAHAPTGSHFRPPVGATIVTHKIPLVVSATSTADELDLLDRNMSDSLVDSELPGSLRTNIVKGVHRARSALGSTSSNSASYCYPPHTFTPIFILSNVTGEGMEAFKQYLFRLHNYRHQFWNSKIHRTIPATNTAATPSSIIPAASLIMPVEFSIDEIFTVDSVGSVVSGTILSGIISEGDTLLLGPISSTEVSTSSSSYLTACTNMFRAVLVKSLHISRKCFRNAKAGQSVTLALKKVDRSLLRRGMVLLSPPKQPHPRNNTLQPPSMPPTISTTSWPRSCIGFEAYIRLFDPFPGSTLHHGHANHSGSNLSRYWTGGNATLGLGLRYQPIVHVGNVRQTCEILTLRMVTDTTAQLKADEWVTNNCRKEEFEEDEQPNTDLAAVLEAAEAANSRAKSIKTSKNPTHRSPPSPTCALVRFEFLYQSEYLRLGRQVLFREDRTRGTGIITKLFYMEELSNDIMATTDSNSPISSSISNSPAPRSDNSSPDDTQPSTNPPSSSSTGSSPSANQSTSKTKGKRSSSRSSTSAASNIFQQAKEARRRMEQVALKQQRGPVADSNSSGVLMYPTSVRTPFVASRPSPGDATFLMPRCALPASHIHTPACFSGNATAQSVPNTPASIGPIPTPLTRPNVVSSGRRVSDSDSRHPPPRHQQSPPASYVNPSETSPRSSSTGSSPYLSHGLSHSVTDPALSAWRIGSHQHELDSFHLPAASHSDTLPSIRHSLLTLPLSRIMSTESNQSTSSSVDGSDLASQSPPQRPLPTLSHPDPSLQLLDVSDDTDEEEAQSRLDSISDLFGSIQPEKQPRPNKERKRKGKQQQL